HIFHSHLMYVVFAEELTKMREKEPSSPGHVTRHRLELMQECIDELGVMFPVAGGVVRYPHYAFGSFASYTSGWITWLSAAGTVGIEVLAAIQYASSYLPWLMESKDGVLVLTGPGILVSIAMVAVFCIINMFGVKFFAHFNNVLVWWK